MNILVTGGAGFIGSHVAKKLMARGDKIAIIDNFNDYYDPKLKEDRISIFLKGLDFKLYRGNVEDKELLNKVFSEHHFDKVCHLAAQAGVRHSLTHPETYIGNNVMATNGILEAMKNHGVKDLVYASSSSVYGGNTKVPYSEEDSVDHPISLYAAAKKTDELQTYAYHHLYGLNCWGLRFFTVYGPWGRPDMAMIKFTKAISQGQPIDVYNQGKHRRDFTYIDDIVSGVIGALDNCQGYEVINLGESRSVELEYFIEQIEKNLDKKAVKNYLPLQPGDVFETSADITKARKILNYNPQTNIEEGIKKFVAWYKEYYN